MRFPSLLPVATLLLAAGCSPKPGTGGTGTPVDASIQHPCTLPGALQFTASGTITVPGGSADAPSLAFLHLPAGFCAHYYGTVGNARQLRFAPGGELFVASPTTGTTGGGAGGLSAIVVLPDDNSDGLADSNLTFLGNLPSTQGLLFAKGHLYYQDHTQILRVPYQPGDRSPSGAGELVADVNGYTSPLHWPKTLDMADDGTIYVGNGGDQNESCAEPHPFHGGVLALDGSPNGTGVARGLRNPIAIRCAPGHNQCFALELAKDYSATQNGREKMIPLRTGDDWGFPCCATKGLAYTGVTVPGGGTPDCTGVVAETNGFFIGDTPFGLDFEQGHWPSTWAGHAYVANHGAAGTWTGARIVSIPMDPSTGLPTPSSNTSGTDVGMVDFATGWDDDSFQHGRPAALTFAPDGRLFVASDTTGIIFWIAAM